jgi:hypothetical protein
MATQTGSVWAQNIGYRIINSGIDEVTITFAAPRTITADTAIALLTSQCVGSNRARCFWAECGIRRLVRNGVTQGPWDPPVPRIQRTNVTEITFRAATHSCRIRYRWVIHFWQ